MIAPDRLLTDDESSAVQSTMGMSQDDVNDAQGTLAQADARSKNVRLIIIKLAALALAQS